MDRLVAGHAPNFLPYLGFLFKAQAADCIVLRDTVEYSKAAFHNRNRVRTNQTVSGWTWLTLPISRRSGTLGEIGVANSPSGASWQDAVMAVLYSQYGRAPYFEPFAERLVTGANGRTLADVSIALVRTLFSVFSIETEIVVESELIERPISRRGVAGIVDYLQALGSTRYLMGPGGRTHPSCFDFRGRDLRLFEYSFESPIYPQIHGSFVPNLSCIDYLMNQGPVLPSPCERREQVTAVEYVDLFCEENQ